MKSLRSNLWIVPGFNAVARTRPDWSPHTGTSYYWTIHNITSLWSFLLTWTSYYRTIYNVTSLRSLLLTWTSYYRTIHNVISLWSFLLTWTSYYRTVHNVTSLRSFLLTRTSYYRTIHKVTSLWSFSSHGHRTIGQFTMLLLSDCSPHTDIVLSDNSQCYFSLIVLLTQTSYYRTIHNVTSLRLFSSHRHHTIGQFPMLLLSDCSSHTDIVLSDSSQCYFSPIISCHSTQCSTPLTTSSLPWVGAHVLVQCITIDIFYPPTPPFSEGAKLTTCHM
jgi:hypothetical protein